MKTKTLSIIVIFLCSLLTGQIFAQDKKENKKKETVSFYVEELFCENCQARVEKNIAFEKGVTDIQCDLPNKTVTVTYKTDKTNPEKLIKGFEKIGMTAVLIENTKTEK